MQMRRLEPTNDIRLHGTVALITGGAGGLGRAMGAALAKAGASVVLADINGAAAVAAAKELAQQFDGRAAGVACDITRKTDCQRAVAAARENFGALHVLVNNAGKGPAEIERSPRTKSFRFWQADPDVWQEIIVTNVNGTFLMARTAVPPMVEKGWGRIINISTSLQVMQRRESSPYGVSKLAIEAETLIWAQDLAGTGVTVNTLEPGGAVDTGFVHQGGRDAMAAEGRKLLPSSILGGPIVWLAAPHSDGCTGVRFVGRLWDNSLPVQEAATRARGPSALGLPPDVH
jgi:NAD(P)-dependent dehydrogenase (short-subunit alcohol dehydrogenase family)